MISNFAVAWAEKLNLIGRLPGTGVFWMGRGLDRGTRRGKEIEGDWSIWDLEPASPTEASSNCSFVGWALEIPVWRGWKPQISLCSSLNAYWFKKKHQLSSNLENFTPIREQHNSLTLAKYWLSLLGCFPLWRCGWAWCISRCEQRTGVQKSGPCRPPTIINVSKLPKNAEWRDLLPQWMAVGQKERWGRKG